MKINEVESLVGITKRNIRFYEKEGLLTPNRNSKNGYRDYTEADITALRQVKLLRKLGVPLEEIRKMQRGTLTLSDGMRRHIIQLEREQENLDTMKGLCQALLEEGAQLPTLDAGQYLERMEQMEREGTRFVNIKKRDTLTRYAGPLIAAAVFIAFMVGTIALMIWGFTLDPQAAPPLPLLIFLIAIPAAVILGVLLALFQRFKQIKGGEEDAAAQY